MAWKLPYILITSNLNRYYSLTGKTMTYSLTPPSSVKGMTLLNRDEFNLTAEIPCLKLNPPFIHKIMPIVKKYLLKLRHWKSVKKNEDHIIIHLDPEKVEKFEDIDEKDRSVLSQYTEKIEKTSISIKYDNWSADKILRAVIPNDIDIPASYTKVGHIVHLNLRDNQLPFKNIIAQVYLDTVSQTRTVVNKLNNIDTKYRNFSMEILAGDDDTVSTIKENNCTFTFDFAKVYWNSRLGTEHAKLLTYMKSGDVLYDVFAGVGPFAVPAARNGVTVLANDLNPDSYKWLQYNATKNKTTGLICFNKDGREFLRDDVKNHILNRRRQNISGCEHIAMNLPAIAVEFLDVFENWGNDESIELILRNPPLIHLYCFVKAGKHEDPEEIAKSLVEETINTKFSEKSLKVIHHVRNVAPNKEMMRVSFYLTEEIMRRSEEPPLKRMKENNIGIAGSDGEEQDKESVKGEKCI